VILKGFNRGLQEAFAMLPQDNRSKELAQ